MHIQAHTFTPSISPPLSPRYLNNPTSKTLASSTKPSSGVQLNGVFRMNSCYWQMRTRGVIVSASEGQSLNTDTDMKRKVVEHICLLTSKEDLSEEEEKDMMDFLYTTQYQMGGIIAISLGRISSRNLGNYTHAIFMRFQRKEDLSKFYKNPFYLDVLKDHVMPYCHGIVNVDYESEVEDDILPIFRKGEDFNYGVEFMLLLGFSESSLGGSVEDALASLAKLTMECPSLIVQATQGPIFNGTNNEYTHVVVIRFRSCELSLYFGLYDLQEDIQYSWSTTWSYSSPMVTFRVGLCAYLALTYWIWNTTMCSSLADIHGQFKIQGCKDPSLLYQLDYLTIHSSGLLLDIHGQFRRELIRAPHLFYPKYHYYTNSTYFPDFW